MQDTPRETRQPRRLPIVTINGKQYFEDERLREYRAVDNPHERIAFDDAPDAPETNSEGVKGDAARGSVLDCADGFWMTFWIALVFEAIVIGLLQRVCGSWCSKEPWTYALRLFTLGAGVKVWLFGGTGGDKDITAMLANAAYLVVLFVILERLWRRRKGRHA